MQSLKYYGGATQPLKQVFRSMLDVVFRKARDEEVRVIVVGLVAHLDAFDARPLDGLLEVLGEQLLLVVEVVASADVDEAGQLRAALELGPDQFCGVAAGPQGLILAAKVAAERLLAPGALARVADGRQRADAAVLARVLQEQGEGAVAAHAVAGNGHARLVELVAKGAEDGLGQLLGDVRLHVVVLLPGLGRGVNVEAGALAKVPAVLLARQVGAPRRRVRVQHGQAGLAGGGVEEALL